MLSRYYPSFRLQIEFLNVDRNIVLYEEDPLSPHTCGVEYAFAITMFSNPLAWLELSNLSKKSVEILSKVIKTYRQYQDDILKGYVLPIGEEPSGTGWTGFQSISGSGSGYLLIIKEYNQSIRHKYKLWSVKNTKLKLEKILGTGSQDSVMVDIEGNCVFNLEGKFTYSLYKYSLLTD
ncbi:MAG: hypothetical protein GX754_08890 [Clostridiaceae bacterium]|nr:hypothetical protein [Clostridiaceae bacterium]